MAVTWHDGMKFRTMYNIIISAFTMIQKMFLYSYEEDIRQKLLIREH